VSRPARPAPGAGGNSVVNSRAMVLNAIFAKKWPTGVPRPTLPQIRAVLLADAAMSRAQRERDARITAEKPAPRVPSTCSTCGGAVELGFVEYDAGGLSLTREPTYWSCPKGCTQAPYETEESE
jgi:hypothetical protein